MSLTSRWVSMLLNGRVNDFERVELVKLAVIVVVGEVDGDDLVHLIVFEQGAQRRVVEIAALDVIVAIDGDRLEIRDGGDAGEEGVHECVETGVVDAAQNLVDVEETPLSLAQVGGANIPAQVFRCSASNWRRRWSSSSSDLRQLSLSTVNRCVPVGNNCGRKPRKLEKT
jgi:hypothetical protein